MRVEVDSWRGERRCCVIVSVVLPVAIDLALRSNTQRRVEVLGMREAPVLLRLAAAAKPVVGDG